MDRIEDILQQIKLQNFTIIRLLARLNFSSQDVESILRKRRGKNANKVILAFNRCDGKTSALQIAKQAGIDPGNFSRDLQHWEKAGILMRVPASNSNEVFPLALLPIINFNGKDNDDE